MAAYFLPDKSAPYTLMPFVLFGPFVIGVAWLVQIRFIFHSRVAAVVATILFALFAVSTGRFALRVLSARVRREIDWQGLGAAGWFGNVEM